MLVKTPAYSLIAIVTLALGIGATVAIFSAVYAAARGFDRTSIPYADYVDWREQRDIFAHVAVWRPTAVDVAGSGTTPERVDAASVGESFFDVLGVRPIAGRTFQPGDHDLNAARVVVLSYGLWQRALGGRGLALTAIGGAIGLAGALATGRLISRLLFQTAARIR